MLWILQAKAKQELYQEKVKKKEYLDAARGRAEREVSHVWQAIERNMTKEESEEARQRQQDQVWVLWSVYVDCLALFMWKPGFELKTWALIPY
jgi:hypothetical protein